MVVMFRELLSSRLILAGLVLLFVVAGACWFYSWHVKRTIEAELAKTDEMIRSLKNENDIRDDQDTVDITLVDSDIAENSLETVNPQMSDATVVSPVDNASEMLDTADASLPEEAQVEDVPVSPFGFGPYPDVPQDFDYIPSLHQQYNERTRNNPKIMKRLELLSRVQIKAWKEGVRGFKGASTAYGKVYLHFPNTVYVKYDLRSNPDGSVTKHIRRMQSGHVDLSDRVIPEGAITINMDEAGYDPYTYLDLSNN